MWRLPFLFSDMFFPVWWIAIMAFLLWKRVPLWKAWMIATGFIVFQAIIVAKTIGWNIGAYFILFIGFIPSWASEWLGAAHVSALKSDILAWWVFPVLILLVIPTLVLYAIHVRRRARTPTQAL